MNILLPVLFILSDYTYLRIISTNWLYALIYLQLSTVIDKTDRDATLVNKSLN
jgi:hypothetical protein